MIYAKSRKVSPFQLPWHGQYLGSIIFHHHMFLCSTTLSVICTFEFENGLRHKFRLWSSFVCLLLIFWRTFNRWSGRMCVQNVSSVRPKIREQRKWPNILGRLAAPNPRLSTSPNIVLKMHSLGSPRMREHVSSMIAQKLWPLETNKSVTHPKTNIVRDFCSTRVHTTSARIIPILVDRRDHT